MHVRPRRRSFLRATPPVWTATVVAVCFTALVAASPLNASPTRHAAKARPVSIAGTWSGSYSGAFSGSFTLRWTLKKSRLTGTILLSLPKGTYRLSGSILGKAITFGAVGAGATYTGTVSGAKMSGSYKTPRGGGKWSAHKVS